MQIFKFQRRSTLRRLQSVAGVALLLILQTPLVSVYGQSAHKTPRDSFLSVQVNSVSALAKEISSNPKVSARYAKLYHLKSSAVAGYMLKNVQIERLPNKFPHAVYCVTNDGVVFTEHETLSVGEKVFALRNGVPVLRWACGNPFDGALPVVSPRSKTAGIVVFTGNSGHHASAALIPESKHHLPHHARPITESAPQHTQIVDNVPPSKVAANVSSIAPSPPIAAAVSGPTEIDVPANVSIPPHIPLTPFLMALPIAFFGSHSTSSIYSSPRKAGSSSPTGITGGGTQPPDMSNHNPNAGSSSDSPALTPEPGDQTIWLIGTLVLLIGILTGRKKARAAAR